MSDALSVMEPQVIDPVETEVDRAEVFRYVGYPAGAEPNRELAESVDRWIDDTRQLATPRATYVVLPVVRIEPRRLRVRTRSGEVDFEGAMHQALGGSRLVAAMVATAGPDVERLSSRLMEQGDALGALVTGSVGSERAQAAETAVMERLRRQAGEAGLGPTLPYSPGYCGMHLTEQRTLFSVVCGHRIGVHLTPSCSMRPIKSVSGLIGLAPVEEVRRPASPCDRCDLLSCSMRR